MAADIPVIDLGAGLAVVARARGVPLPAGVLPRCRAASRAGTLL